MRQRRQLSKDEIFDYIDVFVKRGPYKIHVTQKYFRDIDEGHYLYAIQRGLHILFVDECMEPHRGRIDEQIAIAELEDYLGDVKIA